MRAMKPLFVVAALISAPAHGQVTREAITTSRIATSSPAHYVHVPMANAQTAAAGLTGQYALYPHPGGARLVDVIIYQQLAGGGGTSVSVDVRKSDNTSMFTTLPVITLASGADQRTDVRGNLALPSGWTRGVLKSDSTPVVLQGERIAIYTTESGTYTTHAQTIITLVFEPLQ